MKTLLYNPIFINPQAYYVFPRLTRYLQPDNESTAEPANYIGTIEVRVIAYGDTNLVRTYTNTNEIDLSEFKNTYIRISLFTKVGSCVLGEWKVGGIKEDLPYIDPQVLESLRAVVVVDNKNNYDKDRATITNLVDPDNPFIASNFAWKANSGYGKYEVDFDTWRKSTKITSINDNSFSFNSVNSFHLVYYYTDDIKTDVPSFQFKLDFTGSVCYYIYINEQGKQIYKSFNKSGIYETPISYNSKYTGENIAIGFTTSSGSGTITQIPSFQGALVTDGIDDLITSTKTVQEMLGGSTELTVVSMIHHIYGTSNSPSFNYTNYIREDVKLLRTTVKSIGESGIYGYTYKNSSAVVINNILGDKNDYSVNISGTPISSESKFSVQGYIDNTNNPTETSQVAWYWTFIAKRVLTTDEINQVIAYYNLDKYVKPDIYYDVKRQGLTNNTPDSDWYLKDFSGNGHDMQLYNYGKTPESGINEEGGLQSDGVLDYGQFVGDLGLKDYTVVVDRAYPSLKGNGVPVISNIKSDTATPFLFEFADNTSVVRPYSFGATTVLSPMELSRKISYQSTYIYDGTAINKGLYDNTGNGLTIGRFGIDTQYANIALWSLLLFPYTLSEFLLERQLKKYKLGTLYPDMVEVRPIINSTGKYFRIEYRNGLGGLIQPGSYLPIGSILRISVVLNNNWDEVSSLKVDNIDIPKTSYSNNNFWIYDATVTKSPQKIDITIDEYIRFEDIVQPYPAIVNIPKVDGGYYTYGDKIPVGYRFRRESAINLLPELYSLSDIFLNGELCNVGAEIVISKSMVFTANKAWLLDTTEPHAIYSPQKLNIPNSSLKILGYVPDLTGKGNHGKLNNFAYTEDSGVAADGSIKFDGTDDHITIPTLAHGGKCVMMKVNWTKAGMLYDQRLNSSFYLFGIYTSEGLPAYNARNNGSTYIDGILNTNIIPSDLVGITHNITVVNDKATDDNTISPILGASVTNATFSGMFLYEFMLFHEIPSEDEIKKLNDVMGIEGGYVESPDYYWDAYGKANSATLDIDYVALNQASDAHKRLIDKSRAGLAALELYHNTGIITELNNRTLKVNNFAFNEESGYGGQLGIGDLTKSFNESYVTNNWKRGGTFIKGKTSSGSSIGYALANWYDVTNHILKFKIKITGLTDNDTLYIRQYNVEPIISQQLFNGINEVTLDLSASPSPTYRYINFNYSSLTNDVDFEFLYEYPNGLVSDGVEDNLKNANMPVLTDYTWIMKRKRLNDKALTILCHKGEATSSGAFLFEYIEGGINTRSFGATTNVTFPDLISYQTKNSYNGQSISVGSNVDGTQLRIFMGGDTYPYYTKAVFYKAMLYSKTIDMLSINMLKNLFEIDELINVKHPIFKK